MMKAYIAALITWRTTNILHCLHICGNIFFYLYCVDSDSSGPLSIIDMNSSIKIHHKEFN